MTTPTVIIDITELNGGDLGTVKGSDIYPAVDTTDVSQSASGTTKPYQIAQLLEFILNSFGLYTYQPCITATTVNLTSTYDNGISGVGATLTNSGTLSAFTLNGLSGVLNGRYVIKNQTNPAQNGIYTLTTVGDSLTTQWVLTRAVDFNRTSNIINGGVSYISLGTVNANTLWQVSFTGSVTVGTTDLNWSIYQIAFPVIPTFPLSLPNGGTAAALVASNGGIVYSNASTLALLSGIGTAGLPLLSSNNSAPSWGLFPISLGGALTTRGIFNIVGAFDFTATLTANTNLIFPTSGTVATTGGSIANASNIAITDDTTTNSTMYPLWVTANSGFLPAKVSSTKITFNPNTGTLTATIFAGSLSGNAATATTATSATNAANVAITNDTTTNANMFPVWVTANTGNLPPKVSSTKITFNPSTATLTTSIFSGSLSGNADTATTSTTATNATNATNTTITDDTATNATMYVTWVTTTSGNLPQKISSTKFTFNPNTGNVAATSFNSFTGAATAAQQNAASSTTTYVTPANQHNSPSGLKAFGNVTNNGAITVNDSDGTASVVRNSAGTVTVTLSRAMTNTFYVPQVQLMSAGTGIADVIVSSTTVFVVSTYDNTFTLADLNFNYTVQGHSIT